jgi:branched-chain amino acid transport system substrate-binding protein
MEMKEKVERFCSARSRGPAMALLVCIMMTCSFIGSGFTMAHAGDAVAMKEWKIPMLTVLTGPVAFAGVPAKWAAEYAVNEINAAGGIRGVPVKLTVYDTAMDNAKAVQAMARAIPGSLVVLGPLDGRGSTAVAQQLLDNKILSLNSNTNAAMLSSSKPYSVAYMQDHSMGNVLAAKKWFQLEPWIKSVAMFYDPSDPATKDAIDKFQANIAGTGTKVVPIEISAGQLDFGPPVLKAMSQKVDGYFSSYIVSNHVAIAKELHNRGITRGTELIGGMAADGPELFTIGKGFLENSYLWENINPVDSSPKYQKFWEAYKKDFKGQTPNNTMNFYDAVYSIKTAIETLKITGDPQKIAQEREAIDGFLYNSPELEGLQFKYRNVNGEKVAPRFVLQIKNNQFVRRATINP